MTNVQLLTQNWKTVSVFSRIRNKTKISIFMATVQCDIEVLAKAIMQEKYIKGTKIGRKIKL